MEKYFYVEIFKNEIGGKNRGLKKIKGWVYKGLINSAIYPSFD